MFTSAQFIQSFPATLARLADSEKITKETLRDLSRDLLSALHTKGDTEGDIGFINRTIAVLTPINKRVFVLYCKRFTGFIMNEEGSAFLKKSKKHYDNVSKEALEFIAEPANNLWTWSAIHVDVEPKAFDLKAITAQVINYFKKAEKAGVSKADVLSAIIAGGIDADMLIAALDSVGYEVKTEDEPALM